MGAQPKVSNYDKITHRHFKICLHTSCMYNFMSSYLTTFDLQLIIITNYSIRSSHMVIPYPKELVDMFDLSIWKSHSTLLVIQNKSSLNHIVQS